MKKTTLLRYVQLSLGAVTVAFLLMLTTPEVTLVFTTTTWLFFGSVAKFKLSTNVPNSRHDYAVSV